VRLARADAPLLAGLVVLALIGVVSWPLAGLLADAAQTVGTR
jgi:hypothetical protein